MATYTLDPVTSMRAETGPVAAGSVFIREVSYDTGAIADGDVYKMLPIFQGETVVDVLLLASDCDNNTDLTLSVGFSGQNVTDDPNAYISASTIGQAGGVARLGVATVDGTTYTNLFKTFTEAVDTTRDNRCVATLDVTGANAGDGGTLTLRGYFVKN